MGLFSIRKTNTVFYNSGEIEIVYQTLNNQLPRDLGELTQKGFK